MTADDDHRIIDLLAEFGDPASTPAARRLWAWRVIDQLRDSGIAVVKLPEPMGGRTGWQAGDAWAFLGHYGFIQSGGIEISPQHARDHAAVLLAAATASEAHR